MKTDKIAILLATYNGALYLEELLNSILSQTSSEWELFVHDDGSTDETVQILARYASKYQEKIHILSGPATGGAKMNFFYLMEQVQAPYYMFCDQDDVWLSEKVEKTFSAMKAMEKRDAASQNQPLLVFTDLSIADEELNIISPRMSEYQKLDPSAISFPQLLIQNVITGCTVMINEPLAALSCARADRKKIIMHDWWCALIASAKGNISFVPESLILYRQHGNNSVGAKHISDVSYLRKKLSRLNEIKSSLADTRIQAEELARVMGQDKLPLAAEYAKLGEKSKAARLLFYKKNGVKKSGWERNLGLVLFG